MWNLNSHLNFEEFNVELVEEKQIQLRYACIIEDYIYMCIVKEEKLK